MEKAKEYLDELKRDYNRCLAHNEPVALALAIKAKLNGARDMYELLSDEECCIEENRYGELELYFYKKEE